MTKNDRTVQVPVSLLRELHDTLGFHVGYEHDLTQHVGDLLSQPTPTVGTAHIPDDADQLRCAHCGRIEDMAPLTEFTADTWPGPMPVRWRLEPDGWFSRVITGGRSHTPDRDFDPSTIRDVTPPAGA